MIHSGYLKVCDKEKGGGTTDSSTEICGLGVAGLQLILYFNQSSLKFLENNVTRTWRFIFFCTN